MFQVLDELITPLTRHISQLLEQPASGTDDALTHGESKKGYLNLLGSIMTSKLQGVFLSERMYLTGCRLCSTSDRLVRARR